MLAVRMSQLFGRRAVMLIAVAALVGSVGSVMSCASDVPPTVTRNYGYPIEKKMDIFLIAPDERARITESLEKAGLKPVEVRKDVGYTLDVRLGGNRRTEPCGSVRNVTYILSGPTGRLLVIKGRGATGTCQPNLYDGMSALMASLATS
jgi:hypothetical protein